MHFISFNDVSKQKTQIDDMTEVWTYQFYTFYTHTYKKLEMEAESTWWHE